MSETWEKRPAKRGDCLGRPRPCPWVSCKYHTLLDVNRDTGTIIVNIGMKKEFVNPGNGVRLRPRLVSRRDACWPVRGDKTADGFRIDRVVEALVESDGTCLLDMVDGNESHTLEETGSVMNVTRERIRQIEEKAIKRIKLIGREYRELRTLAGED